MLKAFGEDTDIAPARNLAVDRPAHSLVTILTELLRTNLNSHYTE